MVEKSLGEVVIRTPNMQKMVAFYRDVIDLEPFKVLGTMQFFKVSEGLGGQAQAIGLFELGEVSDVDDTTFDGHDVRKRHSTILLLLLMAKIMPTSSIEYLHWAINCGQWSIL